MPQAFNGFRTVRIFLTGSQDNRIKRKEKSCRSENRDLFGESEKNLNNRYLIHRHFRAAE